MSEPTTQLETVNLHVREGVATIELNRPDALNAWNGQFGEDLLQRVAELPRRRRGARDPDHRRRTRRSPPAPTSGTSAAASRPPTGARDVYRTSPSATTRS